ncbi:MAG TPA: transposase [Candidatus Acidoferrum sp.]|nr:transposase [Candidatus Acidoferrum sp.]
MDRKIKDTPPRLPVVFQQYSSPLYLVTFNTLRRRPLLACAAVHEAFREYAGRGFAFHIATGRYVLMPDHVHIFVRIGHDITLRRWESGLKQCLGKTLKAAGHEPTTIPGSKLQSFWQPGFFDHLLRDSESYSEKWDYVWRNPVRAGLVARPEDWPYQGEIHTIDRVQV